MRRHIKTSIIIVAIAIIITSSFIGSYFSHQNGGEKYENINWTADISGARDLSNTTLMPLLSGDTYIPTKDELDKTMWDKNKINIDVQYHEDPTVIANRYGLPFGTSIVYDKSGNKMLLRSDATMARPVYFDPSNEIYNPTSFVPNYEESILLRSTNIM